MANRIEAPNVVSESVLKHLIVEEGHSMEVVCQSPPELVHGQWRGSWFVKAIDPDTGTEKLLIPFRVTPSQGIKIREFKTATGLISFIVQIGFEVAALPMVDGQKSQMRRKAG